MSDKKEPNQVKLILGLYVGIIILLLAIVALGVTWLNKTSGRIKQLEIRSAIVQIGPQGIQGIKGDTGIQGIPGPQGIPGKDGKDGANGAAGAKGEQGPKGETGLNGKPARQIELCYQEDGSLGQRYVGTIDCNPIEAP